MNIKKEDFTLILYLFHMQIDCLLWLDQLGFKRQFILY